MLIKIQSLTKRFGQSAAVTDATILVEKPQMIGVIGRSGAGKSTLLRMINRLTDATSGEIVVDGVDVLSLRGAALRRWRRDCAMIFQQFNLVPRLDVVTNVMLGRVNDHGALRSLFNVFPDEDIRDAVKTLERLGIAEHALKRAEDLSGGQQQRVAIARALMQRPKMVLADEPIASLDPLNAEKVMDALRAIHEEDGLTVMCNLHTLDTARAYCDRIIGMRDGRIVFDGTAAQLTRSAVHDIYGAEVSEAMTSTALDALTAKAALAAGQMQAGQHA